MVCNGPSLWIQRAELIFTCLILNEVKRRHTRPGVQDTLAVTYQTSFEVTESAFSMRYFNFGVGESKVQIRSLRVFHEKFQFFLEGGDPE